MSDIFCNMLSRSRAIVSDMFSNFFAKLSHLFESRLSAVNKTLRRAAVSGFMEVCQPMNE
jgi:hypothetical protein